ncbi:hypothetical protein [Tuwongella immobilis]|uniref:Uncharacterized protein n=1 Tax=Tuwongella immobilis TaxID=692036 RepID=A0A6C2YRB5_9BACT|nr:hypothetical protein [Tuwongella immobilis]VIP04026.1 Uncharacterized protein OS=Isosphaera pallida (strain ATCC 43644 / DSM 9630 / IS1B) GN=Isop_2897 PE=4 SV=1 [Tuwongella immobilis]VTS05419.1 Uncharacterized protein OS=Isosphaera pallida (strain ATCC 43644 / DSM 9630 / IS1B) GN=Isop_2897 PE=4 SV=1 [Tuwongella immobilis]
MRTWIASLALIAGLTVGSLRADDKGTEVELDGMKSMAPAAWKEEAPSSSMRLTQFKIPKVDGDDKDAELAVFFFKGGSGSLDANLKRQQAKFEAPEDGKLNEKIEKLKVGARDATLQDITGTFLEKFPPFAPNAKITRKPNYRQLYVVFDGEGGSYYLALLGPAKTVEKHKADFVEFLKKFK